MLQNNPIESKIDQLWDNFWSGWIANPLTAIEQITYLLFMKRLDDLNLKPFAIKKEDLRWSEFKHMQTKEMFNHVQGKVFPFLKDINGRESHFTDHMKNAVFMIAKPSLLYEAVKTIDSILRRLKKTLRKRVRHFRTFRAMFTNICSLKSPLPVKTVSSAPRAISSS